MVVQEGTVLFLFDERNLSLEEDQMAVTEVAEEILFLLLQTI
jgi:hypothetical protein